MLWWIYVAKPFQYDFEHINEQIETLLAEAGQSEDDVLRERLMGVIKHSQPEKITADVVEW